MERETDRLAEELRSGSNLLLSNLEWLGSRSEAALRKRLNWLACTGMLGSGRNETPQMRLAL